MHDADLGGWSAEPARKASRIGGHVGVWLCREQSTALDFKVSHGGTRPFESRLFHSGRPSPLVICMGAISKVQAPWAVVELVEHERLDTLRSQHAKARGVDMKRL